jgi:hypothetical protein
MDFRFKNMKLVKGLSEETPCFTGQLVVDGKVVADLSNRGHGDPLNIHPINGWTYEDVNKLEAHIAATYPKHEYEDMSFDESLESLAFGEAWKTSDKKNCQSLLSRKVVFTTGDKILEIKAGPKQRAAAITHIMAKYVDAVILNNLPFDEAFNMLYKYA